MEVKTNYKGFYFLAFISSLYMGIMLFDAIMTNRYVGTDEFYVLGGTLSSPFLFILSGIITEVYRRRMAFFIVITTFVVQTMFAVGAYLVVVKAPYPHIFHAKKEYYDILGPSLLWIDVSGFFAFATAQMLNSYLIMEFKFLTRGKVFWKRTIGATVFSELIYTSIAISLMEFNRLSQRSVVEVIILSLTAKVLYTIVLAYPANILIDKMKYWTKLDPYGFSTFMWINNKLKRIRKND